MCLKEKKVPPPKKWFCTAREVRGLKEYKAQRWKRVKRRWVWIGVGETLLRGTDGGHCCWCPLSVVIPFSQGASRHQASDEVLFQLLDPLCCTTPIFSISWLLDTVWILNFSILLIMQNSWNMLWRFKNIISKAYSLQKHFLWVVKSSIPAPSATIKSGLPTSVCHF